MIPAWYLLITFLAQAFLTYLIVTLQATEHRATEKALIARNPQDLHLLESPPLPARKPARAQPRLPDFEAEFNEPTKIRPLGL